VQHISPLALVGLAAFQLDQSLVECKSANHATRIPEESLALYGIEFGAYRHVNVMLSAINRSSLTARLAPLIEPFSPVKTSSTPRLCAYCNRMSGKVISDDRTCYQHLMSPLKDILRASIPRPTDARHFLHGFIVVS
jgi:hypothetical protein